MNKQANDLWWLIENFKEELTNINFKNGNVEFRKECVIGDLEIQQDYLDHLDKE